MFDIANRMSHFIIPFGKFANFNMINGGYDVPVSLNGAQVCMCYWRHRRRWPSADFDSKIYPNEMDDLKIKLGVLMITPHSLNTHTSIAISNKYAQMKQY